MRTHIPGGGWDSVAKTSRMLVLLSGGTVSFFAWYMLPGVHHEAGGPFLLFYLGH